MQYAKIALLAALTAPFVAAQDLSQLPTCAQGPAIAALGSTGCALTDFGCICKNQAFLTGLQSKLAAACSPADLAKATTFAVSLCAQAGVTLTVPGAPATTSAAAPVTTPVAPVTTAVVVSTPSVTTVPTTVAVTSSAVAASTTLAIISQITDGQPQAPTNATVIAPASPTITPFKGAATSFGVQLSGVAALVGAVGVFFAW